MNDLDFCVKYERGRDFNMRADETPPVCKLCCGRIKLYESVKTCCGVDPYLQYVING